MKIILMIYKNQQTGIQFSEISENSFKMTWEMNYIKILNFDNNYDNKIKYKVEIRKDNNKFTVIYEGINNNCFGNNLDSDTNYAIRMLSFYNDIIRSFKIFLFIYINDKRRSRRKKGENISRFKFGFLVNYSKGFNFAKTLKRNGCKEANIY